VTLVQIFSLVTFLGQFVNHRLNVLQSTVSQKGLRTASDAGDFQLGLLGQTRVCDFMARALL
jgi:hypothetical protein